MKQIAFIGVFLAALTTSIWAQEPVHLSLQEVQDRVAAKNLQLKAAHQAYVAARGDFRQTNSLILPSISASHTALATTNPLMAFGSKLNQEVLTQADFNPVLLNNPDRYENFATRIEVLQPLVNLDGFLGRRAAKLKMEAMELQSARTQEYMQLAVFQAYKQLQLAYQAEQVMAAAVKTAEQNAHLIASYVGEGLAQKADELMVQVRVAEVRNGWQYAQSNVRNASDALFALMDEDGQGRILVPEASAPWTEDLPTGEALGGLDARKDIQAMHKATQAYGKMQQSSVLGMAPRLNAFGTYELYDTELLQFGADGYTVGAQLSWNVFDGYKAMGKAEKAKAEHLKAQYEEQQYRNQSEAELAAARRQAVDAKNQWKMAELALAHAQEAYRIRENRFKAGLEKTTDLLMAETLMFEKELALSQALFNVQLSHKFVEFLTK